MEFKDTKVDLQAAQAMLDEGQPVLRIAFSQEVSPQRIYQLLNEGRLKRPTSAATSG